MTFYKAPPTLTFGDKYEVLLKEISLGSTFPGVFKIKVENEDKDMNPVFRIEDSIFKGGSVESSLKKTSVYRKFEFLSLFVYLLKNGQFSSNWKSAAGAGEIAPPPIFWQNRRHHSVHAA